MSCLSAIGKLFIVAVVALALFIVGVLVLAALHSSGEKGSATSQPSRIPEVLTNQANQSAVATPEPTPPPPPPSLEQRIEAAQDGLSDLKRRAQNALESATSSQDPDSALRQVAVDLEAIADGPGGANDLAKQLREEMTQIAEKSKTVKANTYLSNSDKVELSKTLATQQAAVQKTLSDAQKFCDTLRSIQSKEIPAWTSTYSHFVTVVGASEALNKVSARIRTAAKNIVPKE